MYLCMFQSTPPHGGRQQIKDMPDEEYQFQSTPPHGGRLYSVDSILRAGSFQSTPPHGGRLLLYKLLFLLPLKDNFCEAPLSRATDFQLSKNITANIKNNKQFSPVRTLRQLNVNLRFALLLTRSTDRPDQAISGPLHVPRGASS